MLAVNTLLKDSKESNPMIRGLALRTMCTLRHEAFREHRLACIHTGLNDNSPYVKRSAVMACKTLSCEDHAGLIESGIVDKLYSLIRDQDPVVAVNCLLALEEILAQEGGVVVNKGMVKYLLSQLENYTTWGIVYILKLLPKYTPKSEQEVFDLMNILDPYLQHNSCSVTISTLEVFLHLLKNIPELHEEVFRRLVNPVLNVVSMGNAELSAMVLDSLKSYEGTVVKFFSAHCKVFYCRHRDPAYLKERKLKFIVQLIDEDSFKEILEEVTLNCKDPSEQVSLCAIQALGQIVVKFPELSDSLLKAFIKLLSSETDYILSNTLQVLVTLPVKSLPSISGLVEKLCMISYKLTDRKGLTATLNMIGHFGCNRTDCVTVIEHFIDKFGQLDEVVKTQLILTTLQLFSVDPAQYQFILGELLDLCWNDSEKDLRDQVKFYMSLLKADVGQANRIFNNFEADKA